MEAERRADWRAYFAGVAPRLEKPPKPSEAFVSLLEMESGSRGGWQIPANWKVHKGSDTEAVQRMQFMIAGANLKRQAKERVH